MNGHGLDLRMPHTEDELAWLVFDNAIDKARLLDFAVRLPLDPEQVVLTPQELKEKREYSMMERSNL